MTSSPVAVTAETLRSDIDRTLTGSSYVAGGGIPVGIGVAEAECTDNGDSAQAHGCGWLIESFYQAYVVSFRSGSDTGVDLLYTVARDAYEYAIGPEGPYAEGRVYLNDELKNFVDYNHLGSAEGQ